MNVAVKKTKLVLVAVAAIVGVTAFVPVSASAAERLVKEVLKSQAGWEVDKTKEKAGAPHEERNLCAIVSEDECAFGAVGGEPGGFQYPVGVAVGTASGYEAYVAGRVSGGVQVLTATGEFVRMFGREVDKTTKADLHSRIVRRV
jgi:hypothetical protein